MSVSAWVLVLIMSLAESYLQGTDSLWDTFKDMEGTCDGSQENRRSCHCDPHCVRYKDCCKDSVHFKPEEQRLASSPFTCTKLDNTNVYVVDSCPPNWKDIEIRFQCQHPDTSYRDPLFDAPVTSHRTKITYRNSYCATCHRDIDYSTDNVWPVRFDCGSFERSKLFLNTTTLLRHITYDSSAQSWILNLTAVKLRKAHLIRRRNYFLPNYKQAHEAISSNNTSSDEQTLYKCTVYPSHPKTVRENLRLCYLNAINKCAENWTNSTVETQCEAYTSNVWYNCRNFRNYHCIICNNVDFSVRYTCDVHRSLWSFDSPAFSVLLDWKSMKEQNLCNTEQIYDPFSRICRKAYKPMKEHIDNATWMSDSCLRMRLSPLEFIFHEETMTVSVPAHNKTYQQHEFAIRNDSSLEICAPDLKSKHSSVLQYVTIAGLTLSIIFLILHLVVFIATPKLRNLSTMNLASLCVSLLFLYSTFVVSWFLKPQSTPCVVVAILIHYSLLASFCWMLVISFDIWRALRQATNWLQVSAGMQGWRFGKYSAVGWFIPALIVGTATSNQFSHLDVLPAIIRPRYGVSICWINNANALLVYVVTPLAIVMSLNVFFFSWSACIIFTTTSETKEMSTRHTDYRLYARLALMMGLNWITGLVAGYVNWSGVWGLFVLLNTLQGFFIFLAFSCTGKMWKELREQCPWKRSYEDDGMSQLNSSKRPSTTTLRTFVCEITNSGDNMC